MGDNRRPMAVMAWMSDLAGMKKHETLITSFCRTQGCKHFKRWKVDDLIAELGSDKATLWDRHPPCDLCDGTIFFHAAPGPSTASRPLVSRYIPPEGLPIQATMDGWFGLRSEWGSRR